MLCPVKERIGRNHDYREEHARWIAKQVAQTATFNREGANVPKKARFPMARPSDGFDEPSPSSRSRIHNSQLSGPQTWIIPLHKRRESGDKAADTRR